MSGWEPDKEPIGVFGSQGHIPVRAHPRRGTRGVRAHQRLQTFAVNALFDAKVQAVDEAAAIRVVAYRLSGLPDNGSDSLEIYPGSFTARAKRI